MRDHIWYCKEKKKRNKKIKIRACQEEKKRIKESSGSSNGQYFYQQVSTWSVHRLQVESHLLVMLLWHLRLVELDFLVGTENPTRLLHRGKLRRYRWMRAAATNRVSPTERTGFVGFSRFWGQSRDIEAGFTCDKTADWITGVRRGGARCQLRRLRPWLVRLAAYTWNWERLEINQSEQSFKNCDFFPPLLSMHVNLPKIEKNLTKCENKLLATYKVRHV